MRRTRRWTLFALLAALVSLPTLGLWAAERPGDPPWQTDYARATSQAENEGKMLVMFFYAPGENRLRDHFQSHALADREVREKLRRYVCLRVPTDAKISVGGKPLALLEHAAFGGMEGRQGIAILDFAHRDAPYYGCVVSTFPFTQQSCYAAWQMSIMLDLPAGMPDERKAAYAARAKARQPRPEPQLADEPPVEVHWLADYYQATEHAERAGKMLLIYFCDCEKDEACQRLWTQTLCAPAICRRLRDYVCVRLPPDLRITSEGKELVLLEHPAFKEMLRRPGIAIIDYMHKDTKHYGQVVSTFPLTTRFRYTPEEMAVILTLPPGTLTQRTLIYAVRIHPERPESTAGEPHSLLLKEAESHSQHQADIRVQGHHQWDYRFQRITAQLPPGLSASEVCAESWPGENLVEAAIECVRCWRTSGGHWSAVRARHRVFGYDMKRGANGIWYATGIFGRGG